MWEEEGAKRYERDHDVGRGEPEFSRIYRYTDVMMVKDETTGEEKQGWVTGGIRVKHRTTEEGKCHRELCAAGNRNKNNTADLVT